MKKTANKNRKLRKCEKGIKTKCMKRGGNKTRSVIINGALVARPTWWYGV